MSGSLDLCGAARCTAPTTSGIHVAGGSSVLQLPASAGCQHAVPSLGEIEPREVLEVAAGGAAAGAPSRLPAARPHPVDKLLEAGGHGRGPPSDDADLSPLDGSLT